MAEENDDGGAAGVSVAKSRVQAENIAGRDINRVDAGQLIVVLGDVNFGLSSTADAHDATTHTLPETMAALLAAVRAPSGRVILTSEQLTQIVREYKPGDIREYLVARIAEWSQPRYRIDHRFVNLTLLLDHGEDAQGARWAAPEGRRFTDLRDVLRERADDPVLVLLGAPGSGKSTLLRRLQLDTAADTLHVGKSGKEEDGKEAGSKEVVTFFLALNAYKLDSGKPGDWVNAEWKRLYPQLPHLDELLAAGKVLLLLDAINEMPHGTPADYHHRVGLWRDFIQTITKQGNRAVFSCRSLDYSASLSNKELRVPQVVVQPMDDSQVQAFLQAYLPGRAEATWRELHGTPQLSLFRTPYFLKLLCSQVEAHNAVPQGRAGLFAGFVRQALDREIGAENPLLQPDTLLTERDHQKLALRQWRSPFELPERGALVPALSRLAYAMQEKGLETEGAQVRVAYDQACALLGCDPGQERQDDILKAGVSLNILDEDLAQGEVLFFHQLLQEFFAARKLASEPKPELVWVAWQADKVSPSLGECVASLADSDPLPLLPQTGWEETTVLASVMAHDPLAFIRELINVNLPLAARCVAMPEMKTPPEFKRHVQKALIERMQDRSADLRARMAAGLALGKVGDPRFERRIGPQGNDYLLPPLATIPAGEYPIGSDEGMYENEAPAHRVKLETFQIGVFPVTNAEYGLFIAAGGYKDEVWWRTEAAKAWRRGRGKGFTEPRYWNQESFNNPSQPVVGISWHEAFAYCYWLSEQVGRRFRLPSEVEYEAAERGSAGRKYACGEQFEVGSSNTFESNIRRTTAVGIFENATPEGVFDLSGNVYTWTSSEYKPYPYRANDGREDLNRAEELRVVRGGSWDSYLDFARAAYRGYGIPAYRINFIGFRVVGVVPSP
jgi:formylglycine-generating enzyme required for sulfatase activity